MKNNIYIKKPHRIIDGIPIFNIKNQYTDNYEKIAQDHLKEMKLTGDNPFMTEDLWIELESSTVKLILKYTKKGGRILDAGVGLGRLDEMLPSSFDKYGFDISIDYLKIAHNNNIEVCSAQIEDLPYKKEFFDSIICTDVLEHVIDLNMAVKSILSVLKKGGLLFIRVPYKENLSPYLDNKYPYHYAHLRNFDESSIKILFTKVFNCEVIEQKTSGTMIIKNNCRYVFSEKWRIKLHRWNTNFGRRFKGGEYLGSFISPQIDRTKRFTTKRKELEINTVIKKS